MSNPTTLQSSPGLSDILGAYDTATGKPSSPNSSLTLASCVRGSVLSAVAADNGKLSLTAGAAEATAYGILLDASVDTGVANFRRHCHGFRSQSWIVSRSGAHRRGWNRRSSARQATAPDRHLRRRRDRSGGLGAPRSPKKESKDERYVASANQWHVGSAKKTKNVAVART